LPAVTSKTETIAKSVDELKRAQDADILALESRFREESNEIVQKYSDLEAEQVALAERMGSGSFTSLEQRIIDLEARNMALQEQLTSLATTQLTPVIDRSR
jgi:hypothetical protein